MVAWLGLGAYSLSRPGWITVELDVEIIDTWDKECSLVSDYHGAVFVAGDCLPVNIFRVIVPSSILLT